MIVFADSSSIVKVYVAEEQTDAIRSLLAPPNAVVCTIVAYAEVRAALSRAERSGRFRTGEFVRAKQAFEADWQSAHRIDVDGSLVQLAGDLAELHGLRSFDAIHLATAIALSRDVGAQVFFSSFNDQLRLAATVSGLSLA